MPEEVNFLRHGSAPGPLAAGRDLALQVYVQAHPARVRKRGDVLVIQREDSPEITARLIDTSHLVLVGAVDVTAPVLHELMRREIPVSWYSAGGWFLGHTSALAIAMSNCERHSIARVSILPSVFAWLADLSRPSCATRARYCDATRGTIFPWKRL